MSALNYSAFYTKFGNRTHDKVKTPRVFNIAQFSLPKAAMVHYLPADKEDMGPSETNSMFSEIKTAIPVYTPLGKSDEYLTGVLGKPVFKSRNLLAMAKDWHRDHPRFRFFKEPQLAPFKLDVPLVINHSLLCKRFFYNGAENRKSFYATHNQWALSIKAINEVNAELKHDYNNFIFVNVPEQLVPVSQMRKAAQLMMPQHFQMFGNADSMFVFELWKFCRNITEGCLIEDIDESIMKRINIVFAYNDVWSMLNLGDLFKWRLTEGNPEGKVAPIQFSKNLMMFLIHLRQAANDKELIELTEEEVLEKSKNQAQDIQKDDDKDFDEPELDTVNHQEQIAAAEDDKALQDHLAEMEEIMSTILDDDEEDETPAEQQAGIVKENLGQKDSPKEEAASSNIKPAEQKPEFDIEDNVVEAADALGLKGSSETIATNPMVVLESAPKSPEIKGLIALEREARASNMPVAKYKALADRIGKYQEIVLDKEDGRSLHDLQDIKPEELLISEEAKKVSTLEEFDKRYVEEFMERDIVSMITHAQGGGLLVQRMAKDEINTMSGECISYSVRVQPLRGEPSTLRFRIPKIDENGAFDVKGKTYRYRKQRRDLPIRKISPTEVSLTSYFGKTFVNLHEPRNFSYEKWLVKSIRLAGEDKDHLQVKKTYSQNVFDNTLKLPRVFQILALNFKAIEIDIGVLSFDYPNRTNIFGDDFVRTAEALVKGRNWFLVGMYNKTKQSLFMDMTGEMFVQTKEDFASLGFIENVLGLDTKKQPASECTNVKIMGKLVPCGLILAYHFGLKQLLANLNPAYYRTVPAGKQMKLEDHEYAIRFNDYSLILSRRDKLTSYIMGGFLRTPDATAAHSIYEFDKKPIYGLLLQALKFPGRYLKEIDLYISMFVDPITERILIEMKEPTDFIGLIVRANEMLLTMEHPDETDGNYQRICGFERMSGEVWTQLVNSMRVHARHGDPSNYPVEMNPEAVWTRVNMDTTVIIENKINPIQDLKQREVTTYGGNGGRSSRSLVKSAREFNKTSIGMVSEGTVDSGEAGVTTYLSSNPKLKNLYGLRDLDDKDIKAENVFSTSALMAPCSDTDD